MRVSVSHNRSKEDIKRAVERSFEDLFRGPGFTPVQIVNQQRSWQGSTMNFAFDAKAGLLRAPIKGTVEVTDKDVVIEADLGIFEKLFPMKQAQAALERKVRGLLQ